jgi:predicted amidohydrolase YtcJ
MKMLDFFVNHIFIALCLFHSTSARPSSCDNAELIVRHAHVVTMDEAHSLATAFAAGHAHILAVGSEQEVSRCSGPETKTVDFQGKTVLPGLIDVHTHAMEWANGILRKQLDATYPSVRSIADVVALVRDRVSHLAKGDKLDCLA